MGVRGVDDPDRPSAVEGALGLVGVDVHLRDRRVPRDEQRAPSGSRLACSASRSSASPSTRKTVQYRYSDSSWWIDSSLISSVTSGTSGSGSPVSAWRTPRTKLDQAGAAGVDDARLAELVEHLGRAANRVVATRDDPREALDDRQRAHVPKLRLLGHLTDHGQHRPLHRKLHSVVRARRPRTECLGHHVAVDLVALAEDSGHAADDRRENDAGVALGLHRRGALHVRGQLRRGGRLRAVEARRLPSHGLLEVRARVAVGDGVDVERVDPASMSFDVLERGRGEPPDGGIESGADRVRLFHLAVGILKQHRPRAVDDAHAAGGERRRVMAGLDAVAGRLDGDQANARLADEPTEQTDRVRPTAHTGDDEIGQPTFDAG